MIRKPFGTPRSELMRYWWIIPYHSDIYTLKKNKLSVISLLVQLIRISEILVNVIQTLLLPIYMYKQTLTDGSYISQSVSIVKVGTLLYRREFEKRSVNWNNFFSLGDRGVVYIYLGGKW